MARRSPVLLLALTGVAAVLLLGQPEPAFAAELGEPARAQTVPSEPPAEAQPSEEEVDEAAEPRDEQTKPVLQEDEEPSAEPGPGESGAETLSPEEQERRDELKRKREEREAKRRAKKAKQEAKRQKRRLAERTKHEERLAEVLAKGYEALEAGDLDQARGAFENYRELDRGQSFRGEMGLAKTALAGQSSATAVQHALKAAKATSEPAEAAEALSFAAQATLAARPRNETTGEPLPGTEAFLHNALRYQMQALAADPEGAPEARRALEEAFPSSEDERTERFYERFLESSESAPREHARRLAVTYEALLSGRIDGPLVVAGGIRPPEKISGPRPPYPHEPSDASIRQRLVASFVIAPDGTVSDVRVLNGIDRRRDRMAEAVFADWVFEPARLPNGTPVPVHWVMAVNADVEPLAADRSEEPHGEPGEEPGERLEEAVREEGSEAEQAGDSLPGEPDREGDQ
ncbi:MAG: energy transducer TonB [Thermoanaerobaculia bacterium]|nr:energy transducer TonB [Thermoanaerobaculia bacterium]